jgi:predicted enzyme related to lactoylglutathione lyase
MKTTMERGPHQQRQRVAAAEARELGDVTNMTYDLLESRAMSDDWARPVVQWEIEAVDPERQRAFYGALFNWTIGDGPIMRIPPGLGGPEPGPAGHIRAGGRSRVTLYVQVRDLAESLGRAAELGGTVVLERLEVPGGPTLGAIHDPEGNRVMLVQQ